MTPASPSPQRGPYRVSVDPATLRWAQERSGKDVQTLERRFPKYREWETGALKPTYRQLEHFARATYTPFGVLFSGGPLKDELDITDFRTASGKRPRKPSPHLLDTVYLCQRRQDWYHEYALGEDHDPVDFVGSASLDDDPAEVARKMSSTLDFRVDDRSDLANWTLAVRRFADQADANGVLVMISGVVGNNTSRPLDVEEFRGFALSDDLAPLVFVNGADSKAAQMFTLAHELAHIWLGSTGLSNTTLTSVAGHRTDKWCTQVAAELLVPSVRQAYIGETKRHTNTRPSSRRSFLRAEVTRIGERFAYDLIADTLYGRTLYTEAFGLLAIKKQATFDTIKAGLGLR